ncbi:MAG TPA: hypothetical protein DHV52_05330 [Parachlamydiales bacterium]|nr:hypothetical protein [Parachlamydiales bacterium]
MSLSNNVTPSHGRVEKAFDAAGYIPIVGTVTGAVRLVAATVSLVAFAVLSGLGVLGFTSEEAKTRHFALLTQSKDQIKMGLTELIPGLKNLCYYYNKNHKTGIPAELTPQQNSSAEGLSVTATEQTTGINSIIEDHRMIRNPSDPKTFQKSIPAELTPQQNSSGEYSFAEVNLPWSQIRQDGARHDFLDQNTLLARLAIVPYLRKDEFIQGINEKETLKNKVDQLASCYPLNQLISEIKQQQEIKQPLQGAAAPSNGTSGWMHNKMKPALVTLMFMASAGIYLFSTNLRMNGAAPASSPICV